MNPDELLQYVIRELDYESRQYTPSLLVIRDCVDKLRRLPSYAALEVRIKDLEEEAKERTKQIEDLEERVDEMGYRIQDMGERRD